jgi:hypothetical protein
MWTAGIKSWECDFKPNSEVRAVSASNRPARSSSLDSGNERVLAVVTNSDPEYARPRLRLDASQVSVRLEHFEHREIELVAAEIRVGHVGA